MSIALVDQVPSDLAKRGAGTIVLSFPSKLKIQTTGPGADILVDSGPDPVKTWTISIAIEIRET